MLRKELIEEAKKEGFNTNNDSILLLYGILKKFPSKDLKVRYDLVIKIYKFCKFFGIILTIFLTSFTIRVGFQKVLFEIILGIIMFLFTLGAIFYGIKNIIEISNHKYKKTNAKTRI